MATDAVAAKEPELFGHPRGLTFLFTTEMWERFSYYGMRAILVLYLTNFLLLSGPSEHVLGYHVIKGLAEFLFNGGKPLGVQPFSSIIYGNYTAFVYLTPLLGGWLADRFIGQRYTVIIGGVIMAIAEFTLVLPQLLFVGLLLLIIGNGFFKPNISTQVGNLYKVGDTRIDRAYSIFYVGINVGAALAPPICGSLLGENPRFGYHWGFFAAGVGMLIGLSVYLFALRTLPPDRVARIKVTHEEKKKLTSKDWRAIIALILLCIPTSLFWATYEQQGNTINLWAQDFTDRRILPGVIDWQIPVTLFQSFNPVMIFLFTPLVVMFWTRQSKRGKEPTTVTKMALGNLMLTASFVVMAAGAYASGSNHASWLWLLAFFVVITFGELYLSPIGLALVARVAPAQILSLMMGLWFITSFTGNQLQGYIGSFFSEMNKTQFFLLCAGLGAIAAVVTWLFERPLRPILEGRTADNGLVAAARPAE